MESVFKVSSCVCFAGLLMAVFPCDVARADAPPAGSVRIESLQYSGNGCSPGTAAGNMSPDGLAFTLLFSGFAAYDGPQAGPHDKRRSCSLVVGFSVPPGWQYSVLAVDFRGFAALDDKAWGRQDVKYRFRGGNAQLPSHMRLNGPHFDDYMRRDESGSTPRGWSSCRPGRETDLFIDATMQVGAPARAEGYMSIDSVDGEVRPLAQMYGLAWKRCGK